MIPSETVRYAVPHVNEPPRRQWRMGPTLLEGFTMSQSDERRAEAEPKTRAERIALRAEHPDNWIAVDPGDFIYGELVDLTAGFSERRERADDPDAGFYPLLFIDVERCELGPTPDGHTVLDMPASYTQGVKLAVHAYGKVLEARLLDWEPVTGECMRITYQGLGEAKEGQNPPELYTVQVDDRDPAEQAGKVWAGFRGRARRPGARTA